MTFIGSDAVHFNGLFFKRLRGLGIQRQVLRATILVALLMVGPIAAPIGTAQAAVAAPPESTAHVYLLRGVLNIFSLGLDEIGDKLQRQGIPVTIANYLLWSSLADRAAEEYKSGRVKTIILVGHSSGATSLPDMVARLDQLGVPVKLAIGLDSVFHTSLAGHVGRYINFYIASGAGTAVAKTDRLHGVLENVDVGEYGLHHLTIDKNEMMQQRVIGEIDAVVFGRARQARRAAAGAETSATRPASSSADATIVARP
jgi:hypothetical protein